MELNSSRVGKSYLWAFKAECLGSIEVNCFPFPKYFSFQAHTDKSQGNVGLNSCWHYWQDLYSYQKAQEGGEMVRRCFLYLTRLEPALSPSLSSASTAGHWLLWAAQVMFHFVLDHRVWAQVFHVFTSHQPLFFFFFFPQ